MNNYTFTKEELEDMIDKSKANFIFHFSKDFSIDEKDADNWCATHKIILNSPSIFRTISNLWKKDLNNFPPKMWELTLVKRKDELLTQHIGIRETKDDNK